MSYAPVPLRGRTDWADGLFSITLDLVLEPFEPGQWINLGLELGGELVRRAYSVASPPRAPLELYLVRVEGGALTPALFTKQVGDEVLVDPQARGFFTLSHVPPARELWLISTGTGLGPFLSMVRERQGLGRFERVVLVNGARYAAHLAYLEELTERAERSAGHLRYLPVVSRESAPGALTGRVTDLARSGELEQAAGLRLSADAHVLLCGNPQMIRDMTEVLGERGMRRHRKKFPGQITAEKYW